MSNSTGDIDLLDWVKICIGPRRWFGLEPDSWYKKRWQDSFKNGLFDPPDLLPLGFTKPRECIGEGYTEAEEPYPVRRWIYTYRDGTVETVTRRERVG